MPDLRLRCHDCLASLSAGEWKMLMASYPDSHAYVSLLDSVRMDGFLFKSIVVYDDLGPLLYVPMFVTRLDIASLLDGAVGKAARLATRIVPRLGSLQLLGVGMVEAEWSEPGIRPDVSQAVLRAAWGMVSEALAGISRSCGASLVAWLNFRDDAISEVPVDAMSARHSLASYPCGLLSLPPGEMDGYLGMLGRSTRKDLRRRWRAADSIEIIQTCDPAPHLDEIIRLYQSQVQRADLAFGQQRAEFFAQVTQRVPGSYYVLYLKNSELIAFNLLIQNGSTLVDKYFALGPDAGREYGLYFISWLFNIETCCREQMTVYHAGSGSELTKARLGCRFIGTTTRFGHRNKFIDHGLSKLARAFAYTPQVDLATLRWNDPVPRYGASGPDASELAPMASLSGN